MALTDTQQTMDAYLRDLINRGDYSRHYSNDVWSKSVGRTGGIGAVKPRRTGSKVFTRFVDQRYATRSSAGGTRSLRQSSSVRMESMPYSVIYDVAAGKITALRLYFADNYKP